MATEVKTNARSVSTPPSPPRRKQISMMFVFKVQIDFVDSHRLSDVHFRFSHSIFDFWGVVGGHNDDLLMKKPSPWRHVQEFGLIIFVAAPESNRHVQTASFAILGGNQILMIGRQAFPIEESRSNHENQRNLRNRGRPNKSVKIKEIAKMCAGYPLSARRNVRSQII